jgi:hypothetical protein
VRLRNGSFGFGLSTAAAAKGSSMDVATHFPRKRLRPCISALRFIVFPEKRTPGRKRPGVRIHLD